MSQQLPRKLRRCLTQESLVLAVVLGCTGLVSAQAPQGVVSEITPAPAFSGEQLIALPTEDWITNGGNVYNQRYSPLDQINRDNVTGLKAVWRARLGA